MPVAERFSVGAKVDNLVQDQGLETEAQEINLGYQVNDSWEVSAGYRVDSRVDNSPVIVLTQEQGRGVWSALASSSQSMRLGRTTD